MTDDSQLPHPPDRDATWVDRPGELERVAELLAGQPIVAIDTEANSMFAYREQTCITQITVPEEDVVIDTLAFEDLNPIREALDRPDVVILMHGGDYDISMLTRDFGFRFDQVFDTMIAATVLGYRELGLAALVRRFFEVELDKKYQRANWARRPVTDEQMLYLQRDTIFLPALREHLQAEIDAAGLDEVLDIEFRRLAKRQGKPHTDDPEGWRRVKGSNKLSDEGRCVLRALHEWREGVARAKDQPPFKVFAPRTMMSLASTPPRRARNPRELPFMGAKERSRHGRAVLAAVQRGLEAHNNKDIPPAKAGSPLSKEQATRLRNAKKIEDRIRAWRRDEAKLREVPNLVVLPNPGMMWIAEHRPKTLGDLEACEDIGAQRIERYGETFLALVTDPE